MNKATGTPAPAAPAPALAHPRAALDAWAAAVVAIHAAGSRTVYCAECGDARSMTLSATPDDRMALDYHALCTHANYGHGRSVAVFGRA